MGVLLGTADNDLSCTECTGGSESLGPLAGKGLGEGVALSALDDVIY